jgi:hypothetical protein
LKAGRRPASGKGQARSQPSGPPGAATNKQAAKSKQKRPAPAGRPKTSLQLRRALQGTAWELVHPPCVQERADDLAEVHAMLTAGEIDIARDELLWLLEGCRDFVEAHKLLAELAVAENDLSLARAHFGFAYQIGSDSLPPAGLDAPLSYSLPANQPFLESAKGLAWCLVELEKPDQAREVLATLLKCDAADPLGARAMLAELTDNGPS